MFTTTPLPESTVLTVETVFSSTFTLFDKSWGSLLLSLNLLTQDSCSSFGAIDTVAEGFLALLGMGISICSGTMLPLNIS